MGGKTSTSTSQVSIPPEVLARYNSVNAQAQDVASTPFQQYSTNPSAFVQPLTPTQTAGIQNTNYAAGMAQPYFNAATGFSLAGANQVNPGALNPSAYMNPYLNTVLGSTEAMVNQQNQQAMSGQTGNAMSQGYFGGDRAGIAAAVLAGQQQLTGGQLYSGIASDAYNQAMAAAQQQQGVGLEAAQANRAALQQTGSTLAGLGTGAQQAALTGAQAQLGAGQVEQQTGQAGLTALYNQFLQQQSYPFQVAQFLANIAEGTGALSGSTTTQTAPQSIFSDERLKEDMEPVGVGFDGANIYRFRYRGDPTFRVGFSAQEIARLHPEAVQVHPSGFLMVDYGRATEAAAGFARAANDDWPDEPERRVARAAGGRTGFDAGGMAEWGMYPSGSNPMAISQILQAQAQMYGPYSQAGLYGGQGASGGPYGGVQGHVPAASLPVGQLMIAHPPAQQQQGNLGTAIHDVAGLADDVSGLKSDYHALHQGYDKLTGHGGSGNDLDYSENEDTNVPKSANGGRIGRQEGGGLGDWWNAVTGSPTAAAAANQRMLAHQAAVRAAQAQQRAAAARAPPAAPPVAPVHQPSAALDYGAARDAAYSKAHPYGALGDLADWAGKQNWTGGVNPLELAGRLSQPDEAWQRARAAGWQPGTAMTPAQHARMVGTPAPRPTPAAPPTSAAAAGASAGSWLGARAAAIQHHQQQAAAHTDIAQQLIAGDQQHEQPDFVLNAAREQPLANTQPISTDATNLVEQGGFAPANLQAYHPGFLQRAGNWIGDELGAAGRWLASPSQSRAVNEDVAAANRRDAPLQAAAPPVQNEALLQPVQSEAFQHPAVATGPPPTPHGLGAEGDTPELAAARGGFARADGGAAQNPWSAVVSGSSNLTGRARRQDGGGDLSNPQNDDPYHPQGPGLNIPTAETQHPKLVTAPPPGQGGQGGLGQAVGMASDLANIGKFAMMFAAKGGRIGYDDGGPVPEDDLPTATAKVEEKYAPQTVTPQTIAQGAMGREKPLQQVNPPDLTTPTTPLHDTAPAPPPTAADTAPAPPPQPGLGAAAQPPSEGHAGFLPSLFHGVEKLGQGIAGAAGYEGSGHWNIDRLMPLLSAIGTAGSVPTVHPFVALAAGLGGYGKAYMAQKAQEASIAQSQATAGQTRFQTLPPSLQKGMVEADGPALDPTTHQIDWRNTHMVPGVGYKHWEMATGMLPSAGLGASGGGGGGGGPQAGVAGSPGSAGGGQMTGPVMADYSGGGRPRYTIGPSSTTGQRIAQQYGIDPNGSRMGNEMLAMAKGPDQAHRDAAQKVADDYVAGGGEIATDQSNFRAMVDEAAKLPNTGLGAVGPGQGERQLLLNAVNTWGKAIIPGFQGFSDVDQNSSATELLHKLSTIQSDALANKYGQRSLQAAQDLRSVMPGGDLQKATIYGITSQMMIANERMLNFNEYRNAYQQLGLGDVGLLENYNADTADMYTKQRNLLPKMMANGMFQYLEKNPSELKRVEQGYDTTGANGQVIHVPGLGPGFGKLFE